MKAHVFCGTRYRIKPQQGLPSGVLGLCDYEGKAVHIPVDGDTLGDLDVIIHEALHACLPDIIEEEIEETAGCVARLLWRLNWRKAEEYP